MNNGTDQKSVRIRAIDQFRGFAIFFMVLFNYFAEVETLPAWMKHAPDIGLTIADLGAPAFIFMISLTFGLSFHKRKQRDGLSAVFGHFTRRYLAFLGIGAIITSGRTLLGMNPLEYDWGVLQSIGGAGLLTMLVILLPTGYRLLFGMGLLAVYQILLDMYWMDIVINSLHAGLPGTLSWAAIMIISTVLADIFHDIEKRKYFPYISLLFIIAGAALSFIVPISKIRVSASYDLVTIGVSGLGFAIFYLLNFDLKFFEVWGKNTILLYLLSFVVTGIFVLPKIPFWHTQAPLWLVALQASFIAYLMSKLAFYWHKKGFVFSI